MQRLARFLPRGRPTIHAVLFAAYFVLFLYAQNIELVRFTEVTSPLMWSVAGAALLTVVSAFLLRDWQRGAIVATALVVGFFGYGHLARQLPGDIRGWPLAISWLVFLAALALLIMWSRDWLARFSRFLEVVSLVLVLMAVWGILPTLQASARASSPEEPSGLTATRQTQRDIYYFVFDRYGSNQAHAAGYGITDNDIEDWLAEQGFYVARDARPNYGMTAASLASVLNMEYIDDAVAQAGPQSGNYGPLFEMLDHNIVGRFLKEQGYRYFHLGSWFNPTRTIDEADVSLEPDTATEYASVLEDTTLMPLLKSLAPEREEVYSDAEDEKHVVAARFQLREIDHIINEPGPKFFMAHVLLPHPPYVFDADGNYISVEARKDTPVSDQLRAQIEFTNRQIKRIVGHLLARPADQQPIIIVQADEGPYPLRYAADQEGFDWSTATPDELETKYGILNAFYLPPEADIPADALEPYPTITSVNTFRLVLQRYFGAPLDYLEDREYVMRSPRFPYDLTDITDRLATPAP